MRFLLLTVVAAATIGLAAGTADARSLRVPHKSWNKMTTHQKVAVLRKQIRKDHSVLRFWHNHRYLAVRGTPVGKRFHVETHWARTSLKIASRNLHHLLSHPGYAGAAAGWPPHHQLWLCIGRHEGSPTSVNPNGHYGMLQMTYNWMGLINGRASDYPQSVQEWAAERGYKANHYSYSFLYGQWFEWDGASGDCARYG